MDAFEFASDTYGHIITIIHSVVFNLRHKRNGLFFPVLILVSCLYFYTFYNRSAKTIMRSFSLTISALKVTVVFWKTSFLLFYGVVIIRDSIHGYIIRCCHALHGNGHVTVIVTLSLG